MYICSICVYTTHYVCLCVYIYTSNIHVYIHIYAHVYVSYLCAYSNTLTCTCTFEFSRAFTFTSMYMYMEYACTCTCACTSTCMSGLRGGVWSPHPVLSQLAALLSLPVCLSWKPWAERGQYGHDIHFEARCFDPIGSKAKVGTGT